ncbi:MAG: enoyl-CoA hydratase [Thermodesulfobacteriota bacterium]
MAVRELRDDEPVLLHEPGSITRLTLNRPRRRNALSHDLLEQLLGALDRCAAERETRVIVLAGNGPAFSAGHDLQEIRSAAPEAVERLFALCSRVMLRLQQVPQPVIARVHGVATAAGCQLVAACDLAVAADGATFATPGVTIGLFCSTPAVPVVRAVGRKRALEMLLTGAPVDAATALAWGLVNRVVPGERLDDEVGRLADAIVAASADTIALGKRAFYRQLALPECDAYGVATEAMCANAGSDDAREGIDAFLEKRRPVWRKRS